MESIRLNIYIVNPDNLGFAQMFTTDTSIMPRPHKGDDILMGGKSYVVITTVIRINEFIIDVYVQKDE